VLPLNLVRVWKSLVYPRIPSTSPATHAKRRKGLFYRWCLPDILECQIEQDRIFWRQFLHPEKPGKFLEIGGDGIIGSHSLGLEIHHGWTGAIQVLGAKAQRRAREVRNCRVMEAGKLIELEESIDLLAIHSPRESWSVVESLRNTRIRPRWVIVEKREPDPSWCRLLERSGYRLKFFFHDDEYYELRG